MADQHNALRFQTGNPYLDKEQRRNVLEGMTDEYLTSILDLPHKALNVLLPDAGYTPGELRSSPKDRFQGGLREWAEYQKERAAQSPEYASGQQLGLGASMVADPFFDVPGAVVARAAKAYQGGNVLKELPEIGLGRLRDQKGILTHHGSPTSGIREWDMKHRGTGEGGLKEGRDEFQDMIAHGLYSAEEEQIAKGYQKRLVNGVWDSSVGKLTHGELFDRLSDTIASANGLPPSAGAQTASNILASLEKYGSVDKWLKKEELPGGRYNKYYQSGIDLINTLGLKRSTGSTYTTELLPHQDEFLQWDKPLSEQSDVVRDKLAVAYSTNQPTHLAGLPHFNSLKVGNMDITLGSNADKQKAANELRHRIDTESGRSLYQIIKTELGSQKAASEYLESLGIKGVKYLDGSSRKTGEGSYNYVTFRPETEAVITHENGKRIPGAVERAYAKLRDPRSKEIMERMYPELKGTR